MVLNRPPEEIARRKREFSRKGNASLPVLSCSKPAGDRALATWDNSGTAGMASVVSGEMPRWISDWPFWPNYPNQRTAAEILAAASRIRTQEIIARHMADLAAKHGNI